MDETALQTLDDVREPVANGPPSQPHERQFERRPEAARRAKSFRGDAEHRGGLALGQEDEVRRPAMGKTSDEPVDYAQNAF